MKTYDHKSVEPKWQSYWLEHKSFAAHLDAEKPKYYALDMFPFPSGAGLHVGHPLGYTATDIICRKKRHEGHNVLHPMGWDAFGLPAENYAIKTGIHPSVATAENIANFKRQIQSLGFSYDWDREVNTTDPNYYRWTQWLFLQFYKQGMLYEKTQLMNWCPECKVVVANEEIENGRHERCGTLVEKKELKQWMFRITDFADRLLDDLNTPNFYLCHGWGGAGNNGWFKPLVDFFEEKGLSYKSPSFPNTEHPQYEEWKAHFEKEVPKLWPQDVCLGHSLGCTFLLRYISENDIKIDNLILVAPAFGETCEDTIPEIQNFFDGTFDTDKIKRSVNHITVIGSDNDEYIHEDVFEILAEELDANLIILPNRGHFGQSSIEHFPEVEAIFEELERSVIDWPDKIKAMQRNWIGKSEGAEVHFDLNGEDVTVFTTRPDTLFGVTYFVLAPEHPLVQSITTDVQKAEVEAYQKVSASKSDVERQELKEKTGVFTGAYVKNPMNGEDVPVWIADYVMMGYGTGAIMAVPGHDERDHEFAQKFGLDIREVVAGLEDPFAKEGGTICNSDFLDGLSIEQAVQKAILWLEQNGKGERKVNYKLRDWIFTRQRYWGEPMPLVFDADGNCYPLDESELPLVLPETANYEPSESGESPLAKITDWVDVQGYITETGSVIVTDTAPEGKTLQPFTRETSTMPNWAGSNWYWLRYMDANNEQQFCSNEAEELFGPVDLYVGGAEHAVLHLLYARYWHKALYDMGLVSTKEPFKKLVNQGLIVSYAYENQHGGLVAVDEVEEKDGKFIHTTTGEEVKKVTAKMSKSLKNVVNPDDIVDEFGADTLRCYEMFMGPFEQSKQWNTAALAGMKKFLDKVWRIASEKMQEGADDKSIQSTLHKTIQVVGDHIDEFKFNTALSQLMVLCNELMKQDAVSAKTIETLALLMSPFAPHLAEEMWSEVLGNTDSIMRVSWPDFDPALLVEDSVTYAVQVNGKLRADFEMPKDADKETVIAAAKDIEKVAKYLEEGVIKKEIFVPGKIVGFVVK